MAQLETLNDEDPSFLEGRAQIRDRLIELLIDEPPPPELEAQVRELIALLRAESDYDRRLGAMLRSEGPFPGEPSSQSPPDFGLDCNT